MKTRPTLKGIRRMVVTVKDRETRLKRGNVRMRRVSGSVNSRDPLVAFIYALARDYMPSGMVEELMLRHVEGKGVESQYTNGWLAKWAQDVARRLRAKRRAR